MGFAGSVGQEHQLSGSWRGLGGESRPSGKAAKGEENERVLFPCLFESQS